MNKTKPALGRLVEFGYYGAGLLLHFALRNGFDRFGLSYCQNKLR